MKKILFLSCMFFIVLEASSQIYPFDSIPGKLKRRADAVIRSAQCLYTLIKPGQSLERIKKVVTLLNENSDNYRFLSVSYDKYSRVNYIKGAIYDEKGKVIKVLGMSDILDMSAITGSSFYSDDRIKLLYFPIYKYPYTIEYEYEITYSSLISYETWNFQDSPDVSVERSGIQFIVPKEMKLRYYTENTGNKVDSITTPDTKIYTWQEENIPAITTKHYFVKTLYHLPTLYTAPMDFEYGGYKGSMSSWKAYGEWMYNLIKGLDVLPQSELAKVSEIVSKTQDIRERVRLIYEYVQSRTRYVSIQIGIGGLRPAEASAVATNGFGDCKALVNYTMALLKVAGIPSYYTLVRSGEDGTIYKGFVADMFDHIILCVPMERDSVWLECTNQTLPFNYLGVFTDDRYALLITPEGGKMVRTPEFKKSENILKRTGSVSMYINGASLGKFSNYYSGYLYGYVSSLFSTASEEDMKRYLYSVLRFPDFDVSSVSYAENKSENPSANFSYNTSINSFAKGKGSGIYFNPSIAKERYLQDIPSSLKITEYEITTDSISYYLPYGYKVQFLPSDVVFENEFGKFRYQLEAKNDRIIYKRYLEINKGEIPIGKFYEYRNFINSVAKADREIIILTNS